MLALVLRRPIIALMGRDEKYRSIVSGGERGVLPGLLRGALSGMSALYRAGIDGRNFMYSKGLLNSAALPVPVVSVGNLTVGGTGKTPLVEYIAGHLTASGKKVVILSRGYKARRNGTMRRNDEAAVLEKNLPEVPHIQDKNRVLAGLRAVKEHNPDCILLDDGFQYRKLRRDLDIIVIDATNPFGHGRVLPRGLLREPTASLKRAGVVVISKADEVSRKETAETEDVISKFVPVERIFRAVHRPRNIYTLDGGKEVEMESLRGGRVFAFCGIGSPGSFRRGLESLGCEIAGFRAFPDHHRYDGQSLENLREEAARSGAEVLITTQKDAVKLAGADLGRTLYVLRIAFDLVKDEDRFLNILDSVL